MRRGSRMERGCSLSRRRWIEKERDSRPFVIASAAKQSILSLLGKVDCCATLGRNESLVRRSPQSKLSSPGLTGRSSTPRLLIYLKRLWNTGSPRPGGGWEGGLFHLFWAGPR